jgi:hypothetical protein
MSDYQKARNWISYEHDGPVTDFVLCARACDLAAAGELDHEAIANALHDELAARGFLTEGNA